MSTTPNMLLNLPTPTVTNGPQWAETVNDAFDAVDAHDHTPGKGTPVPTQGLNIDEDLDFNGNHVNEVASVRLENQTTTLVGSDDVRNLYSVNGELYYNNAAGTSIAITSNGSIATPSSTNTPAGIVLPYAGVSAPTGYLLCNGAAVSRVTYNDLYAIIGITYGAGDGSTTFNVPNMGGRVPMGVGTYTDSVSGVVTRTLAETVGAAAHTLTNDQIPAHNHDAAISTSDGRSMKPIYKAPNDNTNVTAPTGFGQGSNFGGALNYSFTLETASLTNFGGGLSHNNMQPSLGLNFIIKT